MLPGVLAADCDAVDGQKVVVALLEGGTVRQRIDARSSHRELSEVQSHLTNLETNGIDAVRAGLWDRLVGCRRHQACRSKPAQLTALNVNHGNLIESREKFSCYQKCTWQKFLIDFALLGSGRTC